MLNQNSRLINFLNNNIELGLKSFYVLKTKEVLRSLNILYKEGSILSFFVEDNFVVISVKKSSFAVANEKITFFPRKKIKSNKKYQDLLKQPYTMQTLYISTPKGILSLREAKIHKEGGQPFMLI